MPSIRAFAEFHHRVTLLTREMEQEWRSGVYRCITPPNREEDRFVLGQLNNCLRLAREAAKTIDSFELRGYRIERARELRQIADMLERDTATWSPPLPSKSPAMRIEDISEEEAVELLALSESPVGSVGKLKMSPLVIPNADPSLLK